MANSQKKILIAEDEPSLREMLVMVLEDEDYQVNAAADGEEACCMMNSNHYDLLLTDQFMPKMNGFELISKCLDAFPATKTILVSGGGGGLEAEHGKGTIKFQNQQLNVDIFLKKPCNLEELISIVERLLQD